MKKAVTCFLLVLLFSVRAHPDQSMVAAVEGPKNAGNAEMVIQKGHSGEVRSLAFSPDGNFIVTGSQDKTVKLWRIDGILIRTFEGHDAEVQSVAFSPDGTCIASGSRDKTVKVWRARNGALLHTLKGSADGIFSVAFSPDGRSVAGGSGHYDPVKIRLWSVQDGKLQGTISGARYWVNHLVFSRDGKFLAAADSAGGASGKTGAAIRLWNTANGNLVRSIDIKTSHIHSIALSPDGNFIASASGNQVQSNINVKLWRITDGELVRSFGNEEKYETFSIAFTPDGKYIASGGNIVSLRLWSVTDGAVMLDRHQYARSLAISPDGRLLAIGGNSGISCYRLPEGTLFSTMPGFEWDEPVKQVAVNSQGTISATGASSKISLWSLRDGSLLRTIYTHSPQRTQEIAFSPDGQMLASGTGGDCKQPVTGKRETDCPAVKLWDPVDGSLVKTLVGHERAIDSISFSPDGKTIVSGAADAVRFWSASEGSQESWIDSPGRFAVYSPDGAKIYTELYDIDPSRSYLGTVDSRSGSLTTAKIDEWIQAFNHDGSLAVSYDNRDFSKGFQIRLLHLPQTALLRTLALPAGVNKSADVNCSHYAFSPDDRYLAAGCSDGTIKMWQISDGAFIRTFEGYRRSAVTFSPDSRHLLAADTALRIWNISSGESITLLTKTNKTISALPDRPGEGYLTYHGEDWIIYTPDGYFDSSRHGGDLVAMIQGMTAFGVDQFALRNNRPDIILKRMGLGSPEIIDHYYNQYLKRLKRAGFEEGQLSAELHVPAVTILEARQEGKFGKITFKLQDDKYPLKKYNIYANDVPLFGAFGKAVQGTSLTLTDTVELTSGRNKIEITTINEKGAESHRQMIFANYDGKEKGDLYFLGFGVARFRDKSLDLKYADKDVMDLAAAFLEMEGKSFRKVIVKTAVNEAVTRASIMLAKNVLADAKPDDTVVLFIAGHGIHDTDREATYYFLTHAADMQNVPATAISFDEIESLMQEISPRNKLVLMDTCESGEVDDDVQKKILTKADARGMRARAIRGVEIKAKTSGSAAGKSGLQAKRTYLLERDRYVYNDLLRRSGAIVFSSSKGGEFSYESDKIRNGFFTKELLAAFTQKGADKNADGVISTDELRDFVSKNVSRKTGGLQNPTVDRDNLYQKFGFSLVN